MSISITNVTITGGMSFTGIDPSFLYAFTNFTFTNGNILGASSGNLSQFIANYNTTGNTWLNNTTYYNITKPGFQVWTVPQTGTYEIEVAGSRSGINTYAGGLFANGAIVRGRFSLSQGSNLTMAVGSYPVDTVNGNYNGAGGGGGTFVVVTATGNPLIIGGGAGGTGRWSGWEAANIKPGSNGSTNTYGTTSRQQPYGNAAPGGTLGQGGNSHVAANGTVSVNTYDSGGGGGFYSKGSNGAGGNVSTNQSGGGGQSWSANLLGGFNAALYTAQATVGGFGGGGGGSPTCGGGGGGYSGGGGAYAPSNPAADGGGGGGSYIDSSATTVATSDGFYNGAGTFGGASITNLGRFNSNAGYIKITLVG